MSISSTADTPVRLTCQAQSDAAAQCLDCDACRVGGTAAAWAHNHTRLTGHSVALTFGYVVEAISRPTVGELEKEVA